MREDQNNRYNFSNNRGVLRQEFHSIAQSRPATQRQYMDMTPSPRRSITGLGAEYSQPAVQPVVQAEPTATYDRLEPVAPMNVVTPGIQAQQPYSNDVANEVAPYQEYAQQPWTEEPVDEEGGGKLFFKIALSFSALVILASAGVGGALYYSKHKGITEVANAEAARTDDRPQVAADETPVSEAEVQDFQVAPDDLRYLTIEKLGVHARINTLGLNDSGNIESPQSIFDTGWFKGSSKPGSKGAALIVGHYSGSTKDGVFASLDELEEDDIVTVERGDGKTFEYKVVEKRQFTASDQDLANALSPYTPGTQGLNLVSVGRSFEDKNQIYKRRQIVFTELVTPGSETVTKPATEPDTANQTP